MSAATSHLTGCFWNETDGCRKHDPHHPFPEGTNGFAYGLCSECDAYCICDRIEMALDAAIATIDPLSDEVIAAIRGSVEG